MRNGFVSGFLIILLLNVFLVSGELTFNIELSPTSTTVKSNETAFFDLLIKHTSKREELFDVFSPDVVWDIRTQDSLMVPAGEKGLATKLLIKPLYINPGLYSIPINVRLSRSNMVEKQNILIEVLSSVKPAYGYIPAIRGVASIEPVVDPRNDVEITVHLENQNILNVSRIDVKVRSNLINKDHSTSIDALQKKTITFKAQLDPFTKPQKDLLKITLFSFDKDGRSYQYDLVLVGYEIMQYGEIKKDVVEDKGLLRTKTIVKLENTGNLIKTEQINLKSGFLKKLLTSSNPKSEKTAGELVWKIEMQPGEKRDIEIVTNYWSLVMIILLSALAGGSYFFFRSPLVMHKSARILSTKEGGLSELKVLIHLKNRGKTKLMHVNVLDIVPKLAELLKQAEVGTLEPDKILLHDKKGTIVKWQMNEIEIGEERIITYRIKSSLSIIGGVSLPVAVAKFKVGDLERTTKSNSTSVTF